MENPLDLVYSWQALLVAVSVNGMTQMVKTLIDIYRGHASEEDTPTMKDRLRVGAELRRSEVLLNRVVLPALPLVLGATFAATIPLRPEVLINYCTTQELGFWASVAIYSAWGAVCGQFASYVFDRVQSAFAPRSK